MPTIRPATSNDRAAVASLMDAYSSETAAAQIAAPNEQVILVENAATGPIGLVSFSIAAQGSSGVNVGEVTALFVAPAHRRGKIAMLLLAEAERTSRDQGIAELRARVDNANAPAAAFFRAMGYTPIESGFRKQLPPKRSAKSRRAEG